MAELVTLISKIPIEVIKALKNEENKKSQEDKIDEQQQSQEDGSNKQERPHNEDMQHENYAKESINDMEVSRDEESNKHHILEEQQLLDVNLTAKEDVNQVKLKNQESTDVTDGQDEVGGTVTDSIQEAVDTILFGLSTPSTTKSMDVRELQASKANAPAKQERKKSRVLRSSYISKYGSGSKDSVDFDKKEKLKYAFDGYTINQDLPNELMIDYFQWIAVGLLKTHSAKYKTTSCFFKSYVEKTHTRYSPAESVVELSTQQDYAESIVVDKNEDSIANIIHGFYMPAGLPWYMVDEERLIRMYDSLSSKKKKEPHIEIQKLAVMLPTYLSDNDFYDKTERTNWPSLEAYKGKITQQTGLVNKIPFDVDYVQNIPQRASDSLVKKANEGYTSDNGDQP
ncbi:hypothetical protein CQW23_02455 [Capsicum baccatum]|uniref:Ubiquitin-like protease family profile domain-containing protein n=1 Tax=Capsicum baccatum TaxID=33114 RepID=A0A2G2XRI6_CAPBA|nr:hypothetical protein CQW23_02455 [Capsicum baccatum]